MSNRNEVETRTIHERAIAALGMEACIVALGTMNPHQVIDWTDERVAELREMAQIMPASHIAMKWGVNRNVICGKMARLGIKRPNAPIKRPRTPQPKPRVERRVPYQVPRQAPTEATHEGSSKPVDIWQLTSRTCRYPLWRDSEPISEKLYCGDTVVEGLVYCPCHARLCLSAFSAEPAKGHAAFKLDPSPRNSGALRA
jgi:hypothetical protein